MFLVLLLRPIPLDSTHCWNLKYVEWNHESETFFNVFKECFCSITLSACIYSKTISCQDRIGESMFTKGVRSSKTFNTSNYSGFQMSVEKTKTDTEVVTRSNYNRKKPHDEPIRIPSKLPVYVAQDAGKSTCTRGDIFFGFASHWWKNPRELLSQALLKRSNRAITFDLI